MQDTPHVKLSVALAREALQEASDRVWAIEALLAEAKALRNELIVGAIEDMTVSRISRITKLSRQSIYKIAPGKLGKND